MSVRLLIGLRVSVANRYVFATGLWFAVEILYQLRCTIGDRLGSSNAPGIASGGSPRVVL
jgi:hypothetical protein